jgi:cytochrome oxidase Cu insertion factor (SCO1/SenC/PrrC family)
MASTGSPVSRVGIACCVLLAGAASAELLPPESSRALPHGLAVLDEQDRREDLGTLAKGAPTILLPVFTRCTGTCPMTAVFLKDALAKARTRFRVVVFSFDADDTAQELRDFRERFALPGGWRIVRSDDAAATRAFLDELDFHFMRTSAGFEHPNATFVFSPRGAWAATLTGASLAAGDIEAAWRRASSADDPSAFQRVTAWLIRPTAWILLACVGVTASLAAIVLARKPRVPG